MRRASMTMCAILRPHGFALPGVEREAESELPYLPPYVRDHVLARDIGQHRSDQRTHLAHFRFPEPSRSDGGRTEPDPARVHRRGGIERKGGFFFPCSGAGP